MKTIREHIERFEILELQMSELISKDNEPVHHELMELDKQLKDAFEFVLDAQICNQQDRLERIQFLFSQLKTSCDRDSFVNRVADKVIDDINLIATFISTNSTILITDSQKEHAVP